MLAAGGGQLDLDALCDPREGLGGLAIGLVDDDGPALVRALAQEGDQRDHPTVGIVAYTAVAGDFVRREMARLGIPLLLKSGDAGPLADALHRAAAKSSA